MGCTGASEPVAEEQTGEATERIEVRVGLLNCPASLGLVPFANKANAGETAHDYIFAYQRNFDEVEAALNAGELDVALLQPTHAATLYNTMGLEGKGVTVLDIAGLGDWILITRNKSVKRFENLRGRTLYTVNKGGTLGFTLRYLLELAGLSREVNVVYLSSNTQVVAALSEDPASVGLIGSGATTEALMADSRIVKVVDFFEVWDELTDDGSACIGYVTIARKEFAEAHPEVMEDFVAEHAASVEAVLVDPVTYAPSAVDLGIASSEDFATRCVDAVRVTCITGASMRLQLEGLLQVYANRFIPFIGGAMPGNDFYLISDDENEEYLRRLEELRRQAEERALEEAALAEERAPEETASAEERALEEAALAVGAAG